MSVGGKTLLEWAVEEMNYIPSTKGEDEFLRKLCVGSLKKYWNYVMEHVKSESQVEHIRNNLKLYKYNRQKSDASVSWSNGVFDEATFCERDFKLKELKEMNYMVNKCREQLLKIENNIRDKLDSCRKIHSDIDAKKVDIQSQLTTRTYLTLLTEKYGSRSGGVLQEMDQNLQVLQSKLDSMETPKQRDEERPAKSKAFEKLCSESEAFLCSPEVGLNFDPLRLSGECLRDCGNDPSFYTLLLLEKARATVLNVARLDQKLQLEEPVKSDTEQLFRQWWKAHAALLSEINEEKKVVDVNERQAKIEREKAKKTILDLNLTPDHEALVLKWLTMHEKKSRMISVLKSFQSNMAFDLAENETKQERLRNKREKLAFVQSSILDRQKKIDQLRAKNSDFGRRISHMDEEIVSMAKDDLMASTAQLSKDLPLRGDALVSRRSKNFRVIPHLATVSLNLPSSLGSCNSRLVNASPGRNLSLELIKYSNKKVDLHEMKEFLNQVSGNGGLGDADMVDESKSLLQKSMSDTSSDLAQLDRVINEIVNLRDHPRS